MHYTDFELLVTQPMLVKAQGKKRLTFNLFVPGILTDPIAGELDARQVDELKGLAGGPGADWPDALRLGEALAAAVLPPAVRHALDNRITHAQGAQEGVRVRLMLSGSELNNLPWEFLVFNRGGGEPKVSDFLALMPNCSLVRHTASPLPAWRVEAKAPAAVFVAVASPSGWPRLQVADEYQIVTKALQDCARFTLAGQEHAQRGQLPNAAHPAHVFHFAGHGTFEQTLSAVPGKLTGRAELVLEDEYGDQDPLDADLLAMQLADAGTRVAVLGACQTAQRDDIGAWSSVAEALLKAGLGAVVGMQFPVLDNSAIRFATDVYGSLALGLGIDEAVRAGRVAVAAAGDARGWATPVLYLRSPDGVIFTEFRDDPALDAARSEATVQAGLRFDTLTGRAINLEIRDMESGAADAVARGRVVEAGGDLTNVGIDRFAGGRVDAVTDVDEIKGTVKNVRIDNFGVGQLPRGRRG